MNDILKEATASLEAAISGLTWEKKAETHGAITFSHFTGRGPEWRIEMMTGSEPGERMGTGVRGGLVIRLTDAQLDQALGYANR